MTDQQISLQELSSEDLLPGLSSLLFTALEPVPLDLLATTLGVSRSHVSALLVELDAQVKALGMVILWHGEERIQLATAPRFGALLQRFHGLERTSRLSQAALEVLAIIAYRQPVTRSDIEFARGVDSSGVMQNLLARELIEPVGRLPIPGQPIQYATTSEFLRFFGLMSLHDLPELPEELGSQLDERTPGSNDTDMAVDGVSEGDGTNAEEQD